MDKNFNEILEVGTKIVLSEERKSYATIKKFIDNGSKCNVYEIEFKSTNSDGSSNSSHALLKEFYPYNTIKTFCGNNINTIVKRKFDENGNYIGLFSIAPNESWINSIAESFKQFEVNTNEIVFQHNNLEEYLVQIKDAVLQKGTEQNDFLFRGFYITNTDYVNSCKNLFNYDECSDEQLINNLGFLKKLAEIVNVFHEEGYIIPDLKPSNVLYKNNINSTLRILDMDAVYKISDIINKEDSIPCTIGYASKELLYQEDHSQIGIQTDIYSLGIILLEIMLGQEWDDFQNYSARFKDDIKSIPFPVSEIGENFIEFRTELQPKFENLKITDGTRLKLIKTWSKSIGDINCRYESAKAMANDIEVLIEIIAHKGVHPEVILDSAIALSNSENFFKKDDFDEKLLCDIEEVN